MRSRYVGILLASLPLCAMAQITLTQSNNAPALNRQFNMHRQDVYINPGPAGAGQSWDHAGLASATSFTRFVEDPMGVAGTHLIRGDVDSMYYVVNNEGMFLVKEESMMTAPALGTAPVTVNYQGDGVKMLVWPASYGTSWSGTVLASYTLEGETMLRSGTVNATVDGEGTVNLPYGSYEVLRVQSIVATDESGVIGGINVSGNRRLRTWSYYAEWLKQPLLKITSDTVSITSPLPTSANSGRTEWLDALSVGVIEAIENDASFGLWPTPARDVLNVTLTGQQSGLVQGVLRDLTGRVVREYALAPNSNNTVDINGLPAGQYLLQVLTAKGELGVRKVVIH